MVAWIVRPEDVKQGMVLILALAPHLQDEKLLFPRAQDRNRGSGLAYRNRDNTSPLSIAFNS